MVVTEFLKSAIARTEVALVDYIAEPSEINYKVLEWFRSEMLLQINLRLRSRELARGQ
jgi:hypothetical protein